MNRLLLTLTLTSLTLCLATGCPAPAPAEKTETPPATEAGEVQSADDAAEPASDGAPEAQGGDIGGEGMTHKEGVVASDAETIRITGTEAAYTGVTHDGWTLVITPQPMQPVLEMNNWDIQATAPGGVAVTPGQLLIEPAGQEVNTGKKLDITVGSTEPGQVKLMFAVAEPGSYAIEFHLHRSDGGDSHLKATFEIAPATA